jgi:predicted amidohydrolase
VGLNVALCQIAVDGDKATNLRRIVEALDGCAGADFAVFPEFAMAPYDSDLPAVAEPIDGPFVRTVAAACRERRTAAVLGIVEKADGVRVYNCAVVIDADGGVAGSYRKIHLSDAFTDLESDRVIAGDRPGVATVAGVACGLITCYDLRFPELARALVDGGAQILVVLAAWGVGAYKEEQWVTLAKARAIENVTWVVAVDKAAGAGERLGFGRSLVVDPYGVVRADLGPWPATAVVDLDAAVTARARQTLPALRHRRLDLFPATAPATPAAAPATPAAAPATPTGIPAMPTVTRNGATSR